MRPPTWSRSLWCNPTPSITVFDTHGIVVGMLPREWFSPPKSAPTQIITSLTSAQTADGASHEMSPLTDSRPTIDGTTTAAALSTPHDAVLAELQGQKPRTKPQPTADDSPGLSSLPTVPSQTELPLDPTNKQPPTTQSPARTSSPAETAPSPEPIYDPYTGNIAFVVPPPAVNEHAAAHFEQAKDELWTQLGRIRELQSDIAQRHLQMEGIGGGEGRLAKRVPARTHTDTIVVGEEWPDPAEEELEKRRAREAEFDSLAKTFEGRHAAIDGIMDKLDDLSKVLTSFHALPTPVMDFGSRNNTKDSMATMFSSPSPTGTNAPTSPFSSPTLPSHHRDAPTSLHAKVEALEIPRAESPVSDLAPRGPGAA